MAHYSRITVAALAAALALGAGSMQVSAADAQETELTEEAYAADTGAATESETEAPTEAETSAEAGSWVTENGKQYYILPDGSNAVGETEIDGVPYLFGFSGALKTDWQTVSDKRYYYDPATGEPVFGWIDYFDSRYYVTAEDGKLTGFQEIDGERYAFSEDGALYTGIFCVEDVRYYASPETGVLQSGLIISGEEAVLTDAEGIVRTGWCETEDGRIFYSDPETGLMMLGLVCIDGSYYCITPDDGLIRGAALLEGTLFPFDDETGALTEGWFVYDEQTHYFDLEAMTVLTDVLVEIDGNTYYFDESGCPATGWRDVHGERFWFGMNGARYAAGVLELDGNTYFFDADGRLCYGWQTIAEVDYYFRADGTMAVSDTITNGRYSYTFDENGLLTEITEVPFDGSMDVVSYKQWDEEWADVRLGTTASSSIAKSGCLVTAMAMVYSYNTGTDCTPVDMKDMLSFTSDGSLANWNLISDLGYTVETYSCSVNETILADIYAHLQDGSPVVLGSKKGYNNQHYVVITGYTGDGTDFKAEDFIINDPGYSTKFTLSDHLAEYYTLYKLIY